jgi:hypothetical protein
MADLTQGRMSNPLYNRQQLISLNFKKIFFYARRRVLFLPSFPSQIPVESRNTRTYAHTELLKIPCTSQTFKKLL